MPYGPPVVCHQESSHGVQAVCFTLISTYGILVVGRVQLAVRLRSQVTLAKKLYTTTSDGHVCMCVYIHTFIHTAYKQAYVYVLHTSAFARNSKHSFILVFIHTYIHNPYKEDFIL